MSRLPSLFALAALMLLALGLLESRFPLKTFMAITWNGYGYGIPYRLLCYAAALVLCLFAVLYSLWFFPWSASAGSWHLGLSLVCVGMFAGSVFAMRDTARLTSVPAMIVYVLSPYLFLLVQGWYLADAIRRCLPMMVRG